MQLQAQLTVIVIQSDISQLRRSKLLEMMGWKKKDMFEGVKVAGVAKYLDMSADASINLAFG